MKLIAWLKRFLLSRFFLLLVILSLQIFLLISGVRFLFEYPVTEVVITIVNLLLTVYVVNRDENTSYKLAWVLLIYAIPVFGSVIYLLFAEKRVPATLRADMIRYLSETDDVLFQKKKVKEALSDPDLVQQFDYVHDNSFFPYYQNTDCFYFGDGEAYFNDLIEKIREAKHFVFLEFFIVKDGSMLESLVSVLRKKVAEGVEVYFMYDDGGSVTTLSRDYKKVLSNYGIHCAAFNPVKISLTLLSKTSNRDHRKICVIDNTIAYVGGLNIGDEYINKEVRFGHWKDSALRLEGEAVRSLTVMFIQFYNASAEHPLR
ncbi:MAG: PLDc N-terminal domain-containing protein, partial [Erysipelotrichaceae bacterium]|nr:PLDc N-terminal domain-containing protein [Erysipelotrichaceae bacterium]